MSIDANLEQPLTIVRDKAKVLEEMAHALPPQTNPEELRAVEQVFSAKERESQQVLGLLGLWTSVGMLRDVAIDTFAPEAGELETEEAKLRKKKANREPDPV